MLAFFVYFCATFVRSFSHTRLPNDLFPVEPSVIIIIVYIFLFYLFAYKVTYD